MKIGGLNRSIGAGSKVGCCLALDLKRKDGDSFMDRSVYGHLCTNYGSKWQLDGRYFNGVDNYVDCGSGASLAITRWTLELEANRLADSGTYERMISKSDSGALDYWCQVLPDDTLEAGFMDTGGGGRFISTTWKVPLKQFKCCTATFDGVNIHINVDGDLKVASGNLSAYTPRATAKPFWIGRLKTSYKFNGLIGKVIIDNFADYTPRILSRSIGG